MLPSTPSGLNNSLVASGWKLIASLSHFNRQSAQCNASQFPNVNDNSQIAHWETRCIAERGAADLQYTDNSQGKNFIIGCLWKSFQSFFNFYFLLLLILKHDKIKKTKKA